MKVSLYTSWDIKCGIADYSARFKSGLENMGAAVTVVPVDRGKGIRDLISLGKMMNNADIAHIQHEFSFFFTNCHESILRSCVNCVLFLQQIKIPKVLSMHEVVPLSEGLGKLPLLCLYRIIFAMADVITVHTDKHRKMILAMGASVAKVVLMPHPIPRRDLPVDTKNHYKKIFGVEGKQVLTVFGFPNSRKGYELVLDAIKDLDNCVFLIAGGRNPNDRTGYFEQLVNTIREMKLEQRTKILGYIPESQIMAVMGATDIVLAPFSDMPGSGSLSMGVAYHKPIIGSDIDQMKELQARGFGVDIFSMKKPGDLRDKIVSLLSDPQRQSKLEQLSRSYSQEYSYEKTAARFGELYLKLLKS